MIKMAVIDYRLIHGQVVFGWAKRLQIERLVIIDNKTMKDSFALSMLKLGVPAEMSLNVIGEDQIDAFSESEKQINKKTMVILPNPKVALNYVKKVKTEFINICNIKKKDESERISGCCFLNKEEEDIIMEMIQMGIKIDACPTPGHETKVNLNKYFERRIYEQT